MKDRKIAFLDRDGVLNYDYGYVHKIKDFKWKKNVKRAIKYLNDNNYLVVIVSNQSGIGRGYYKEADLKKLHSWIQLELKKKDAKIDKFYFAPYYKFSTTKKYRLGKSLRKPNIGMIRLALRKWNVDKKSSFIIGDKLVDKKLANNVKMNFAKVNKNSDLLKVIKKMCHI